MSQLQQIWNLPIDYPIIQAPMAGVQDSALAIAVAEAGAIGSLPSAMLSGDRLQVELDKIAAATDRPVNINFFCHQQPKRDEDREASWIALLKPFYEELAVDIDSIPGGGGRAPFTAEIADILEPFKPTLVSFHFGLPQDYLLERVKSWGSKVLASATTVEEARWLEANGADAIIAQGIEAGGHRGMFLSDDLSQQAEMRPLLVDIIANTSLPVIAAGGIGNSEQVAECLALGAAAVQVGTTYLCAHEATTTAMHRQLLLDQDANDTAVTNLFTGRPARGLVNRLIRELGPMNRSAPQFPLAANAVAPLRKKSLELGLPDFIALWSGTNQSGCKACSAAEITRMLAGDIE